MRAEAQIGSGRESVYPLAFSVASVTGAATPYLRDPAVRRLLSFFESKGLAAVKQEDRLEQWYDDWIAYQRQHGLYAAILSPAQYSTRGNSFDLLRYTRFLEVFAYCSPSHGYSLQVTFLGLFSIMMGSNEDLKHEAIGEIEAGNLLAFGVSEKDHGSDLFGSEFVLSEAEGGGLVANGSKYYIGNTDSASMISTLAKRTAGIKTNEARAVRTNRAPFTLFALRPKQASSFRSLGKIRTLGVRAANVGSFEVRDHPVANGDIAAEGRNAWDAIFGAVTLGKFFLGFGSIGICEHALQEAGGHLQKRILYGKPAFDMSHIRFNMARAYARLTAMKLYAYRALDYVHRAAAADRRYQLFCAVQKARVSTEGVKVMTLLEECIGAKGFESDTYFEMALRDVQLIPSLEGSLHINLGLAVQFIPRYFDRLDLLLGKPPSLLAEEVSSQENAYLMEARTGSVHTIGFPFFLDAYRELAEISTVASFVGQVEVFRTIVIPEEGENANPPSDLQIDMAMGQCFATIAYGQLVAENAVRMQLPDEMIAAIFSLLVEDLSTLALQLAAIRRIEEAKREGFLRMVTVPKATTEDWDFVGRQCATMSSAGDVLTRTRNRP